MLPCVTRARPASRSAGFLSKPGPMVGTCEPVSEEIIKSPQRWGPSKIAHNYSIAEWEINFLTKLLLDLMIKSWGFFARIQLIKIIMAISLTQQNNES